jgi:4-hydroxybenzoate polyprenyltransferase
VLSSFLSRLLAKVGVYSEWVKFPHTLFALPFALMGAVLAARGLPPGRTLAWILVAMVGARSGAMGANRLADWRFDALNPRTRDRALPRGLLGRAEALAFVGIAFALFFVAAWQLNRLCFALSPLAAAIVVGYSFTKRFTVLTHACLGLALAIAPIGGWIAVSGRFALPPILIGLAVLAWVAGFDILYALADVEFDRRHGLYSLPARLGVGPALVVARGLHAASFACLAALVPLLGLGGWFAAGLVSIAGLLAYEHLLLWRHGLAKLDIAFFTVNGAISIAMLAFTLADVLLRRGG